MRKHEKSDQCELGAPLQDDRTFGSFVDPVHTAAFSGYRFEKLVSQVHGADCSTIRDGIISRTGRAVRVLYDRGIDTYLCGMATGFDLWAATAVLAMKKQLPGLRLVAVVPFRGQARYYPDDFKELYYAVLAASDSRVCLHETYTRSCFHERNRAMLDRASALVCYFNGLPGGTAYTVGLARKRNMMILNLCGHRAAREYDHKVDDRIITEIMKIG